MSNKEEAAVPVTKHLDQFRAMLEEAEVEFDEGRLVGQGIESFIQINETLFTFDEEGFLIGVDVE